MFLVKFACQNTSPDSQFSNTMRPQLGRKKCLIVTFKRVTNGQFTIYILHPIEQFLEFGGNAAYHTGVSAQTFSHINAGKPGLPFCRKRVLRLLLNLNHNEYLLKVSQSR